MLAGKSVSEFEAEAKELFKKQPGKMKLLIVVDKLLTGFDAQVQHICILIKA